MRYRVGRAGCRSVLPRERFSPVALSGRAGGHVICPQLKVDGVYDLGAS